MTIYVLLQSIQNDHGFEDVQALEAYTLEPLAEAAKRDYQDNDLESGTRVAGRHDDWPDPDDFDDSDWTVCYTIEAVTLYRHPISSVEVQVHIDTGNLPVMEPPT